MSTGRQVVVEDTGDKGVPVRLLGDELRVLGELVEEVLSTTQANRFV